MAAIDEIIEELEKRDSIDAGTSFEYARICSKCLRSQDSQEDGRKIVINILDNWDKIDPSTREMWTDLIESAGFYPYLEKEKYRLAFRNTSGEIRKEFHKSSNLDAYFHEEQRNLKDILEKGDKNLIVSAPTSFGKSLLIQEIVASKKYRNIVITQPSLALIDETRKKLKKYNNDYKIIVRTSQKPSVEKGNLFLLTAERVMEYPEFPKLDFFVMDEFYKLSAKRDEERSDVLNNAFNLLVNEHKCKFYLLGPSIDAISKGFAERYNAEFKQTSYSLVDNRTIDLFSEEFGKRGSKKLKKEDTLFDLLLNLKNEQTIIYCSSPMRVRYMARKFCDFLEKRNVKNRNGELSLCEWIRINIGEKWSLINCLNHGIGIHDGALQKHITSSVIQYFNDKKLNYLFCTTTIIEGVNTSAKNVVFFDKTKGIRKPIDFFDYNNIRGRSGRMMVHYVGRIFNFNEPPEKKAIVIDIPFFEQDEVSDEVLIHIDEKDVKNKESEQYKNLERIPQEERELFKKNGVLVRGQKNILEELKRDIHEKYPLVHWTYFPNYGQLTYVLCLAWKNLIKKGESIRPMTLRKLVKVTSDYGKGKSISQFVKSNYNYFKTHQKLNGKTDEEIFDEAVMDAFKTFRHWFLYKVPKWLNVMNSLQKYVCEKNSLEPGNYTSYSNQIENDFVRENLSILVEYGIPKSAIDKLSPKLPKDLDEDRVIDEIRSKKLFESSDLIQYEREKIIENL
jgi:hypothetical protein